MLSRPGAVAPTQRLYHEPQRPGGALGAGIVGRKRDRQRGHNGQIVHITAISSARVLVLAEIYTEHKLVVTRLNGFMAVESPENRQK